MINKTVIIFRGISGSGKTTMARTIAGSFNGIIHSTDNFFEENGEYKFNPKKLQENHLKNQRAFETSLKKGISPVICDNTNIKLKHMEPYEKLAIEYGYEIMYITIPHPTVEEAFARSTHNVPKHVIQRALDQWEKM